MSMDKRNKFQILMLSLVAGLLFITPLLSTSLRPPYLYFIINVLIVTVGVEAGFLSSSSSSSVTEGDEKKPAGVGNVASGTGTDVANPEAFPGKAAPAAAAGAEANPAESTQKRVTTEAVEKSASEKINAGTSKAQKMKKSSSTPSIFFIGGGEADGAEEATEKGYEKVGEEEEEAEEVEGLSGQELFTKAEAFIGNFYMQLRMQREDSWNRIHGLYHKPF